MKFLGGSLIATIFITGFFVSPVLAESGSDSGYLFSSAHVDEERLKLDGKGLSAVATHQKGVSFGQNEDSPWYRASFLAQGTSLKTEDDVSTQDVALLQFIDKDGDITWAYIDWNYSDAEFAEFYIMSGTGKWEGIIGKGRVTG